MKHPILLTLMAGCLVAADAPKDDPGAQVVALLRKLNEAYLKKDVDTMDRLMSDDHVAILSTGQRQNKAEHLKALADLKLTKYTTDDVQVITPSKDVVILTYRSSVQGTFQGKELPANLAATSVWANRKGQWQEVLYQETALEKK